MASVVKNNQYFKFKSRISTIKINVYPLKHCKISTLLFDVAQYMIIRPMHLMVQILRYHSYS